SESDFEPVLSSLTRESAGGFVFSSYPHFSFLSAFFACFAQKYPAPPLTPSRDFSVTRGLLSYGGDFSQSHRRAGIYAGRVLNGEKPSDLPVQLVTRVEFVVNLKAAKSLGVELSPSLIAGADEVIE